MVGAAGAEGRARGAHPRRRRAADGQPRPGLHRPREPPHLRRLLRPAARGARGAHSAAARLRGPREQARRRHPHAVGRHEAAAHARARARQRSRPPDPRRAHDGPRPAGAPPDLGRPAPAAVAGQDDPADDALHGRGRAAGDAARRDRPRHADRERHAARAARAARGARGDRGVRRRGEGVGRHRTAAGSRSGSSSPARPRSATRTTRSRC